MTRIIVCGGRDYVDRARVWEVLDGLLAEFGRFVLVHNYLDNADALARGWADKRKISADAFCCDWQRACRLAAAASRNRQMLDAGADLVVAFPGGRGTADMAALLKEADIDCELIEPSALRCVECGAVSPKNCGRSFMPGKCPMSTP